MVVHVHAGPIVSGLLLMIWSVDRATHSSHIAYQYTMLRRNHFWAWHGGRSVDCMIPTFTHITFSFLFVLVSTRIHTAR
jgi:hypothetical protein